jgi:heme oxygenase
MQCPVPHTKDAVLPPGHPHRPEIALASPSALGGNSAAGPSSIAGPSRPALRKLLHDSGSVDGVRPDTVDEWPLPEDLDFSRPVSELLRKGTSRAHATAEHSDGAVALTNGQLELQEYIRWLAVIWRVYE